MWLVAMQEEMDTLQKNHTYDLVQLPQGMKALKNKLKKELSESFAMKDMRPAKQILGIHVDKDLTERETGDVSTVGRHGFTLRSKWDNLPYGLKGVSLPCPFRGRKWREKHTDAHETNNNNRKTQHLATEPSSNSKTHRTVHHAHLRSNPRSNPRIMLYPEGDSLAASSLVLSPRRRSFYGFMDLWLKGVWASYVVSGDYLHGDYLHAPTHSTRTPFAELLATYFGKGRFKFNPMTHLPCL
ncbi:hypothetical protein MUK42_26835 [Musa troglodytarum]|uniref:Uncharacterized protein n=1 Tax=Musa troglodytarum TaxID=320322 RepID=A0A9E7K4Y3_9LILI|nr:hypothetical protein MUK42_26835 [Musa troglodytarum]